MPDESGFLVDVARLREQARREIDRGPVTQSYGADVDRVIGVLQEALATELVCTLRYRQHHHTARGMNAEPIAAEFLQHSVEELDHAERIATRISQLGGVPDMDPAHLTGRSHSEYRTASSLRQMVEENLVAERIAIASYTEVVAWLGTGDPTTRRLLEDILAVEEEHADDLVGMLDDPATDGGGCDGVRLPRAPQPLVLIPRTHISRSCAPRRRGVGAAAARPAAGDRAPARGGGAACAGSR